MTHEINGASQGRTQKKIIFLFKIWRDLERSSKALGKEAHLRRASDNKKGPLPPDTFFLEVMPHFWPALA
jgi:hypothetical protein